MTTHPHPDARPTRSAVLTLCAVCLLVGGGSLAVASMRLDRPDVRVDATPRATVARTPPTATSVDRARPSPRSTRPSRPVPSLAPALDERRPTVAQLDPQLLTALRTAANAAAAQGIRITVTSGWRSRAQQAELLRDAVAQYGSAAEAARWVATPDRSEHVRGAAVDLGPATAVAWLSRRGAAWGLCQVYRNEPWHFELRATAARDGCPAPYDDPTQDPRMQP